jgi:hypothetical protein
MIRTQVRLTEKQAKALRALATREGVSMAEIIRRAIDREVLANRQDLMRRALAAAGTLHSDVTDLSTRHDDYLAEAYAVCCGN